MTISSLITAFISAHLLVISIKCEQDPSLPQSLANRLLVISFSENPQTENFLRFNRSLEAYELDVEVLDASPNRWFDRRVDTDSDKSKRFRLLQSALSVHKNEQDLLILIVDSSNLIFNGDKKAILSRFQKFGPSTKLVFSADSTCWPDARLESIYPPPKVPKGQRFLSSQAFIGYAPTLWEIFNGTSKQEELIHDMQLYLTNLYLDAERRQQLGIELDHRSELFQNLHNLDDSVELDIYSDGVNLKNRVYQTEPVVVLGSGTSRIVLNSLGNYLGKAWTLKDGCRDCNRTMISLASIKDNDLPTVLIAMFIEESTPFLEDFFESVQQLRYPRDKIHLLIHNSIEYHHNHVGAFLSSENVSLYASNELLDMSNKNLSEWQARNYALDKCKQINCDYYFALDSVARFDLPDTLRILIEANKTIVAPLLSRPRKLWSNFWGSITNEGYYSRSHDYVNLVSRERLGIWNVPHVMNAYLVEGKFLRSSMEGKKIGLTESPELTYHDANFPTAKAVLIFTRNLRFANVFQYVINTYDFGHLVDPTNYNTSRKHPDFYQLVDNILDWERHYIHDNYTSLVEDESTTLEQPCQDVFWFPLVNEKFCQQMIDIMENFGKWSSGTNDDDRIEGGYESVPTRDIHMKQVGLHQMWLAFLQEYVMPIQLKEYIGYEHDPPRADLAFVVRYHPDEQSSLRPHHDSSTYTLNIALNSPNVDYEGGGCRFVRYNCSVTESRRGWALIHPGRLTHYHEGLPVTSGTRYIMVTFVDP